MRVDIWSDVRCPFCYIGKHKFEAALEKFPYKEGIEVNWHSFELNPNLETQPEVNTIDYFIQTKGITREQAEQMLAGAKKMGEETGLTLNLEKSVVANSFKAHQLIQLANTKRLGNEMEEALFKAHFSEGKNIDNEEALTQIGAAIGLEEKEIMEVLSSNTFAKKVRQDEQQAQRIGISGVPFFVFNNKYGVSGAQPVATFLEVLDKSWRESAENTQ